MKTRKVMALAGAGVLAVSMMTGCGSSSHDSSDNNCGSSRDNKRNSDSSRENCRSYRINYSGRFFRIKTAG